uniref:PH domain-containing protein n=1 Tax=Steinernema glaseri TaxID=37863 RepID=A0A1I7YR62_9BILA
MNRHRVKDGDMMRYHKSVFGNKWKDAYAILHSDSCFMWFNKRVIRRPDIPTGYSVDHLVAISIDAHYNKVYWFLFSSDTELEAWFLEITKTLPKPANPPPIQPMPQQPSATAPPPSVAHCQPTPQQPPIVPQAPAGCQINGYQQPQPYQPQLQPGYGLPHMFVPPQPQNTTIIRGAPGSYGEGFVTGSAMGYGLGSAFNGNHYG